MADDINGIRIEPPQLTSQMRYDDGFKKSEIKGECYTPLWNITIHACGESYKEAIENLQRWTKKVVEVEYPYYLKHKSPSSPE